MTTITIFKSDNGSYKGFTCNGHAGFANYGKDIVCAAISILVINTVNSLEELTGYVADVKADSNTGYIDCKFNQSLDERSKLLVDSMILGLENIEQQYGKKHLKLKFEEV